MKADIDEHTALDVFNHYRQTINTFRFTNQAKILLF